MAVKALSVVVVGVLFIALVGDSHCTFWNHGLKKGLQYGGGIKSLYSSPQLYGYHPLLNPSLLSKLSLPLYHRLLKLYHPLSKLHNPLSKLHKPLPKLYNPLKKFHHPLSKPLYHTPSKPLYHPLSKPFYHPLHSHLKPKPLWGAHSYGFCPKCLKPGLCNCHKFY